MRRKGFYERKCASKNTGRPERRKYASGIVGIAAGWILMIIFLLGTLMSSNIYESSAHIDTNILSMFQRNLTNQISSVLEGIIPVTRTYILNDHDMIAPKPNSDNYGKTEDPAVLEEVLEEAANLLDGQELLFSPKTKVKEGSAIYFYLDETILAVTWKQVVGGSVYTFSEIKIAHPSQFRRFFSEGKYGSNILHTTTEMANSVNAVVASSGDYYGYRSIGIVVNEGQVYRNRGDYLDTCYIDEDGNLLFTYAGEIVDETTTQKFVEDNSIRFSLSFGPVMILDGKNCVPDDYNSGEINKPYARAALCQMGTLHYLIVTANTEDPYYSVPTVKQFAAHLEEMGIPKAYALDGGQTASIVMDNQLMNTVSYGSQREISDIIYFSTAIPDTGN